MSSSAWSVALEGMRGTVVEVEAAIGAGLPRTVMVGLPDTALHEAKERCKAAITGARLSWPQHLLTINLTPAGLPKSGTHYDVAIAAAVLAASQVVPAEATQGTVMMGELTLDGRVRAVRGVLPALVAARDHGLLRAIVPAEQVAEARLVEGMTVWGIATLPDLVEVLHGRPVADPPERTPEVTAPPSTQPDFADIVGQPEARWALEVAAAGRHHIFLQGAPGVGKTMLASRLPTILPDLTQSEALEVTAIHSVAGHPVDRLITRPPFASPHHNASLAAMVGGGNRVLRPGCVSMAHRGVLFLDEAPEFGPKVVDALRTPLEQGTINIARAQSHCIFPAQFQLVLAANPCPCGYHGIAGAECRCTPYTVRRYTERLSGPILDRIDIHQTLTPVRRHVVTDAEPGESSAVVAERVRQARDRQRHRLSPLGLACNGEVPGSVLRRQLPLPGGAELLDRALSRGQLSARGVDKVIRVAWTLADLAGTPRVTRDQLRTALAMRRAYHLAAVA